MSSIGWEILTSILQTTTKYKTIPGSTSLASKSSLARRKSVNVELSLKSSLRRSSRLTKKNEQVIDLTQDDSTDPSLAHEEDEGEDKVDEEDGMGSGSHESRGAEHNTNLDSDSDTEGSLPLRLSHGSLASESASVCFTTTLSLGGEPSDVPRWLTQTYREHNRRRSQKNRSGTSSRPSSVRHTLPHPRHILSPDLDPESGASPAPITNGTKDGAPRTGHPSAALVSVSSSLTPETSPPQSSDIENMLLSRGLPLVDAERIALLFSSLGIVDKTYLRVFARLAPSREAWLSEMRKNGQLSEIQAWVVVDILDTVVMD